MRETTGFAYKHAVGVPQEELMEYQEPMFIEDILPAIQKHVIGTGDRTDFSLPPLAYTMEQCSKERVVFLDVDFNNRNDWRPTKATCPIMYFRWEVKMLPQDRKFESLDDIRRTFTKPMLFSIRADEMIVPNEGDVSLDEYAAAYNRYPCESDTSYFWGRQFLDIAATKNCESEMLFNTRKKNGNLWLLNLIDKLTFAGNEKRSRIVFCCKAGSLPIVEDALIGKENVVVFDSVGSWDGHGSPVFNAHHDEYSNGHSRTRAFVDEGKYDMEYVRKHCEIVTIERGYTRKEIFDLRGIGCEFGVKHVCKIPSNRILRKMFCSFFFVKEMAFRHHSMKLEHCYRARPHNTSSVPVDARVVKSNDRYIYTASYQGTEISRKELIFKECGDEKRDREVEKLHWYTILQVLFSRSATEIAQRLMLFNATGVQVGTLTTNIPLSDEEEKELSYYKSVTFPRDDDYQRKDVAESFEDFYTVY